jgi:hypothetical protein
MNSKNSDLSPAQIVEHDQSSPTEAGLLLTALRLLVGGTMEGADELVRRLKERQQLLEQSPAAKTVIIPAGETDHERLRYALIGLLFETPGQVQRGLSTVSGQGKRAAKLATNVTRPFTRSRLLRPLLRPAQRQVDKLLKQRDDLWDRLIDLGREQEQQGRSLARETTAATVDEVFNYLAGKPEIRDLVQQQSVGLTQEFVNELRRRTAAVDARVDSLVGRGGTGTEPPLVEATTAGQSPKTNARWRAK